MQREEKQLEMFLDNSLTKLKDLKIAIGQMIHKIGKMLKLVSLTKKCNVNYNLQNLSMKQSIGRLFWIILH